jgi:WD40 repeat protein
MNESEESLLGRYEPQETKVLAVDPQVTEARFSPCGRLLVAASYDARLRIWDISGEEPQEADPITGHHGWVHAIAFHPTNGLIFSADSWGKIQASRSTAISELESPAADVAPAAAWELPEAHNGWIRQLDVSPDGSRLASCAADGRVCVWSTADGSRLAEFPDHNFDVQSVRFHPHQAMLVSGDGKGQLKQWDLETGKCVRDFDASSLWLLHRLQDVGGVRQIRFNHDGTLLACSGVTPKNGGTVQGEPTLVVFDFATGEQKASLVMGQANDCFLQDFHWTEDGVLICVTCGTPGAGKLLFRRLEDEKPFFESTKMANCQSLSVHSASRRLAVVATNRGSNGNGRQLKDGQYLGNNSPIHLFRLGKTS